MNNFYMIGHLEVPQRKLLSKPLWYFDTNNDEGIRSLFKQMKELTGYQYDNTHLQWSNIFGHLFKISVYYCNPAKGDAHWNIHVWDHTGGTSVIVFDQYVEDKEKDVLSEDNYIKLSEATKEFVRGKVRCSSCHKKIDKSDIAGRYFAGIYCEECWESKYKAIEAKETYN